MADLNQFLNKDMSIGDVQHSNGFGVVAGGGGAGGISIDRRRELSARSRFVGSYRHSQLGSRGSAVKSRTADQQRGRMYDANTDSFTDSAVHANRQKGGLKDRSKIDTRSLERRQSFVEPRTRKYDKYG
ncbi:hypothetical protein KC953_03345 [Candidatus Saccharibacteria bacterium]|nr:hypothetical protein [Candidatus Saccharibacteria bacterium]